MSERALSEREGSQRERGATTVVRPEGRGPDHREERAQGNLMAFLRTLGERPDLLDEMKVRGKDEVIAAAAALGFPFTAAEFDRLVWDLEGRLADRRGEAFDAHFPLWRTLWGRHYLEVIAVDLLPSLTETGLR